MDGLDTGTIILMTTPLIVLQLVLMVMNLVSWSRKKKTKYLNKTLWFAIILLGNLAGNIIYMVIESEKNDSDKD